MNKWEKVGVLFFGVPFALMACLAAAALMSAIAFGHVPLGLYRVFLPVWVIFGGSVFFWQIFGFIMTAIVVLTLTSLGLIVRQVSHSCYK